MEHIERAMLAAKKHDCTVTRVRFPSPAPWIINDLRSSASKVQVNCPLKRLVPMRQVSLLNLVSGPIYGSFGTRGEPVQEDERDRAGDAIKWKWADRLAGR